MIASVAYRSKESAEIALDFVIKEHTAIGDKLGGWPKHGRIIGWSLLPHLAENFASSQIAAKISRFYSDHSDVFKQHPYLDQALEKIQQNQLWISSHHKEACDWFQSVRL